MITQHLTASDLMIGDYITIKDSLETDDSPLIFRVVCPGYDGGNGALVLLKGEEACDEIGIDEEWCGIPLTPEILEKNGIKLLEVGDNGAATPAKDRNRFEKWAIHTQWKDTYLWYDRQAKYWHLSNMGAARLHFVHELQHALRLCEINKEIEL